MTELRQATPSQVYVLSFRESPYGDEWRTVAVIRSDSWLRVRGMVQAIVFQEYPQHGAGRWDRPSTEGPAFFYLTDQYGPQYRLEGPFGLTEDGQVSEVAS